MRGLSSDRKLPFYRVGGETQGMRMITKCRAICLVVAVLILHVSVCCAITPPKGPAKTPRCAKGSQLTRCGCSNGDIPVVVEGRPGGNYWRDNHDEPGTIRIDPDSFENLERLNGYPDFEGLIINGYLLSLSKTEAICKRLSENPWSFRLKHPDYPGGKIAVCELNALSSLILLCHEFGHYKQCWDHQHSVCEDECEQYTKSAEIARKCNNQSELDNQLLLLGVTCGAAFGRCFIGKEPSTDKSSGSCFQSCMNAAFAPSGTGAVGGSAAAAAKAQREREIACSSVVNVYRPNCETKLPFAYCGDGTCQGSEDPTTCPLDCRSQCGNGRCEHEEATTKSCPQDCCTAPGRTLTPERPQCCPDQPPPLLKPQKVLIYNNRCLTCAPEGATPQLSHECCRDADSPELALVNGVCTRCIGYEETKTKAPCCKGLSVYGNVCRDCAMTGEKPKGPDGCCPNQRLVLNKDGICTVEPACVRAGEQLTAGKKCCGGFGTVDGKCSYCMKEGEKVNTDPRLAAPQCCDGLSPAKNPSGSATCEKVSPPPAGGGGNTTNCIAQGQPCSPTNTISCCNGGALGCVISAGGKYQCS